MISDISRMTVTNKDVGIIIQMFEKESEILDENIKFMQNINRVRGLLTVHPCMATIQCESTAEKVSYNGQKVSPPLHSCLA